MKLRTKDLQSDEIKSIDDLDISLTVSKSSTSIDENNAGDNIKSEEEPTTEPPNQT